MSSGALNSKIQHVVQNAIQPVHDEVKSCVSIAEVKKYGDRNPSGTSASATDRPRNIIITGVEENCEADIWRNTVCRALRAAAGSDIHIDDAFHLGTFTDSRKWPILAKLGSVWDRRLVLSGCQKLKDDALLKSVFIRPDEALDVRRQHIFERLKKRASARPASGCL